MPPANRITHPSRFSDPISRTFVAMRKRLLIVSSLLLICALLFGQVGVSFMHDIHDAHGRPIELADGQEAIQQHGEHCKVCAVDLFFGMLQAGNTQTIAPLFASADFAVTVLHQAVSYSSLLRDRAPPILC